MRLPGAPHERIASSPFDELGARGAQGAPMSVPGAPLGGPLGDALASAEPGAAQQLQPLAAPGVDAASKAAALKAQAAEAAAVDGASQAQAAASDASAAASKTEAAADDAAKDLGSAFSDTTPVGEPAVPCACGSHVEPAFDRAAAQQQLVQGLGSDIKNNPLRQEYESKVAALSSYADQIPGKNLDELADLAQQANQERRDLGVQYKNLTPAPLLDYIKDVNLKRYGDPLGPTVDKLVDSGRSYTDIIKSAARPNPDVDKLLAGFSDWLSTKPDDYIKQSLASVGK
jgi:hypothetical protein